MHYKLMDKWFDIAKWSEQKLKKKFNIDYKKSLKNEMIGYMESELVGKIYYLVGEKKELACIINFENKEMFEKFRYYVSNKRLEDIEKEKKRRYLIRLKDFEETINHEDFDAFINKITKEYIIDLLEEVGCFNIGGLAKESKPYFIRTVFHYFEEDEMKDEEIKGEITKVLFYNHYPTLKRFGEIIGEGEGESIVEELNVIYGMRVVEYARGLRRML
jgi:hypothetical protein